MPLDSLIATLGAPAIFAGCALEGETVAFLGGVLAHRGLLPLLAAGTAAVLGAFVSDQAVFLAGRHARGQPRVQRLLARPAALRVMALLARHPRLFIFSFRFIPGMRIAGALTIGASPVPAPQFVALNALAAVLWGTLWTGLGYHFGRALEAVAGRRPLPEHLLWALAGAVLLATGLWLLRRRLHPRPPH